MEVGAAKEIAAPWADQLAMLFGQTGGAVGTDLESELDFRDRLVSIGARRGFLRGEASGRFCHNVKKL